jgi:hypothetical protein
MNHTVKTVGKQRITRKEAPERLKTEMDGALVLLLKTTRALELSRAFY